MQKVFKKFLSCGLAAIMCLGITAVVHNTTENSVVADAATSTAQTYYNGITATGGNELLGQLHDLITKTHTKYTSYSEVKTRSVETDPGKGNNTVMEFYTHIDIANSNFDKSGGWNREHVWAKSLSGGIWDTSGGGSDLHHIRPAEKDLNNHRGNMKYGEVGTSGKKEYTSVSNVLGGYSSGSSSSGTFEPLDMAKGDVARILMYVYTHYNSYTYVNGTTNGNGGAKFGQLKLTQIVTASNEDAAKALLLKWNNLDPVDEIERYRNEAVYGIQGNRNPFIDNSSYANAIWGNGTVDPGPDTPTPPDVTLTGISLNATSLTLTAGATYDLKVTPTPSNASASVTWSSSDSSVATVTNGKIKANAAGTATITATSTVNSSFKASVTVTVKAAPPVSEDDLVGSFNIAVDLTAATDIGKTLYFNGGIANDYYLGTTENESQAAEVVIAKSGDGYTFKTGTQYIELVQSGTHVNVTLKNSSSGTWKYDSQLKTFTWTITASGIDYYLGTRTNGNKTYTTISASDIKYITGDNEANVGVTQFIVDFIKLSGTTTPDLEDILINPSTFTLEEGKSNKLSVLCVPAGANGEVNWTSSDTSVATVAADGTVTAVKAGTATITATSKDNDKIKATATVTVTAKSTDPVNPDTTLKSLAINPTSLSLKQGGSGKLTVTPTPASASAEVNWTTSDTSVATVAADGTVTAIKAGTATITATSKENSAIKATVTVTVTAVSGSVDAVKVEAFRKAVAAIPANGTLGARFAKINTAITAYKALSDADKAAATADIAALNKAISDYNKAVDSYNSEAQDAEVNAIYGAGGFFKRGE